MRLNMLTLEKMALVMTASPLDISTLHQNNQKAAQGIHEQLTKLSDGERRIILHGIAVDTLAEKEQTDFINRASHAGLAELNKIGDQEQTFCMEIKAMLQAEKGQPPQDLSIA